MSCELGVCYPTWLKAMLNREDLHLRVGIILSYYLHVLCHTTNEIASDDCVQVGSGTQGTLLVWDVQLLTKISSNTLC